MEPIEAIPQSIAIAGAGCVLATGRGTDALWRAACEGRSGIGPLNAKLFHSRRIRAFGHVADDVQKESRDRFPRHFLRYASAPVIWGVDAVQQALADASVSPQDGSLRFGLFCCQGGYTHPSLESFATLLRECSNDGELDTRRLIRRILHDGALDPFLVLKALTNGLMGIVSIIFQIEGEANAFMQGVAGNQAALRAARAALLDDRIDVAIVVGAGSEFDVLGLAALAEANAIGSDGVDEFRPFDQRGGGGIAGEGAAALVLRRSRDLPGGVKVCLDSIGASASLRQLSLPVLPVDLLVCGGSGVPDQDRALCDFLRPIRATYVTGSRSLTGILSAAPSLVDLILVRLAMQAQCAPPVAGLRLPLDREFGFLVGAPRRTRLRTAAIAHSDDNGFSACYRLTRLVTTIRKHPSSRVSQRTETA